MRVIKGVLIILGAVLFFQFPVFMQQYQHQLIGHVNELKWQLNILEHTAKKSGKSLEHYIKKFSEHSDRDFSNQGAVMQGIKTRYTKLSAALTRLQRASIFTRPFLFFVGIDGDICGSTLKAFDPGITFSMEGAVYALLGMLLGYILYLVFRKKRNKIAV